MEKEKGQQYKDLGLKVEKNPLEMSFRMTKKNCKMSEQIKWTISGNKLREQNELYFNFLLTIFWKQNLIEDDISVGVGVEGIPSEWLVDLVSFPE